MPIKIKLIIEGSGIGVTLMRKTPLGGGKKSGGSTGLHDHGARSIAKPGL
jgi:hypothetical protein